MLIGWINRADDALLSASSELTTLPGANVQHPHVVRRWHTAPGVKDAALTFDLRASLQCQLLGIIGANISAAATIRLRASDVDPAALSSLLLDTGALGSTAKTGYGASYHDFTATTARYWRLDIADATLADNLQVGRVFLGPRWQPSSNQEYGWQIATMDPSPVDESRGGQSFPDVRAQRRVLTFQLNWMNEAEMYDNAFALARAAGVVRDVLVVQNSLTSAYLAEQSVWGLLTELQPLVHQNARIFRNRFTVKERL
jgi:hypothetical protein